MGEVQNLALASRVSGLVNRESTRMDADHGARVTR